MYLRAHPLNTNVYTTHTKVHTKHSRIFHSGTLTDSSYTHTHQMHELFVKANTCLPLPHTPAKHSHTHTHPTGKNTKRTHVHTSLPILYHTSTSRWEVPEVFYPHSSVRGQALGIDYLQATYVTRYCVHISSITMFYLRYLRSILILLTVDSSHM